MLSPYVKWTGEEANIIETKKERAFEKARSFLEIRQSGRISSVPKRKLTL